MAATVGNIAIGFVAATGGFTGGAEKIIKSLGQIKIAGDLMQAGWEKMAETFERMDNLVDAADQIGIATDSLISLRFAAEQGASSAEGMDAALGTMVKNVGLTSMGVGRAAESIKRLGLDINSLKAMNPEQMFGTFADAISKVTDENEQAAIASRIFGDEGQKLLGVLRGGSAGMAMADAQAEALGLHLGEGARQAAEAHDALARAGGAAQAMADAIVIQLAPSIIKLTDLLINNKSKLAEFAGFAAFVAEQAATAAMALVDLGAGLIDPASMMPDFAKSTEAAAGGLGKMAEKAGDLNKELADMAARDEKEILDIMFKLGEQLDGPETTAAALKRLGATPEIQAEAAAMEREIAALKVMEQQIRDAENELLNGADDEPTNRQQRDSSSGFAAEGSAAAFAIINKNRDGGIENIARQQLRKQVEQIAAVNGVGKAFERFAEKIDTFVI